MNLFTDAMLAQARSAQESLMDATVIIAADGGEWVFQDGAEVFVPAPALYEGPALVQALSREAREIVAGSQDVTTADHAVKVPWTVTNVEPGRNITIVTSPDPFLVGKTLTVTGVSGNDFVTCRRIRCILNLG